MLDGLGWIMHQDILAIVALSAVVVVLFSPLPLLITWKMCTCPLSFPVLYPWHCFQIFSNIIVVGTCSLPLPLEVGTIDGRLTCAHGKQKNSEIGTIDLDVLRDRSLLYIGIRYKNGNILNLWLINYLNEGKTMRIYEVNESSSWILSNETKKSEHTPCCKKQSFSWIQLDWAPASLALAVNMLQGALSKGCVSL